MGSDNKMGKAKDKAKEAMDVGTEQRKQAEADKTKGAEQAARKQAEEIDDNGPMESIKRDDK